MQLGSLNSKLGPDFGNFLIAGFPVPDGNRKSGKNIMGCVAGQLWRTGLIQVTKLHEESGD